MRGELKIPPKLLTDDVLSEWQEADRSPGELVSTWNYELDREDLGLIIEDNRNAEINPFGRETYIRKIRTLIGGSIVSLSKWDIYPPGSAKPSIPF